jgi:transposase
VVKLNKHDVKSVRIVALMDQLFAIDAQTRDEKMDHTPRVMSYASNTRRCCSIRPGPQILRMSKSVLPKSVPGKACSDTLALWQKLTRFMEHPEPELSNNIAGNSMRLDHLTSKNGIHISSQQAGPSIAAILSIVESCPA